MDVSQLANESRVLVIYTGGTIGMLVGQQGYVPEPYFLTETLRSQNRFHDPLQESLFSNAGTVQGFREWSNHSSGRSSPVPSQTAVLPEAYPTLLVRSTRPIGEASLSIPNERVVKNQPRCVKVGENVYEAHLPSLVTPCSKVPGGTASKSIRYAILEWNPLLDSSNIDIQDWIRLAAEIELNYQFDAFVVLHGTDTMSYTSSALSFLLEDLGKTVVITGAQIPMSQLRNDAVDNLMGALTIAGHYIIPECCVYFNHTLYRGNRVTKMSSFDLAAFESPNFEPLVKVGIDINVNWNDVIRQTSLRKFRAHKEMSPHVATLRLFPGIAGTTIKAFCSSPIRGVVLETFGAGNAPQRPDLIDAFKEACDRGVVIVAISQCTKGSVSDAYETGRALLQVGVLPGSDMTPECALTKLSYLLSKPELSLKQVRDLIGIPLRGELTRPSATAPSHTATAPSTASLDANIGTIQHVLSQFVRLSRPSSLVPEVVVTSDALATASKASDTAAPWTWTAAEASTAESVLLPFLIHLAASRNDLESLEYCVETERMQADHHGHERASTGEPAGRYGGIAGGIVNSLDPGSGRSPLHVAALNGHAQAVAMLLKSGALVHLRDTLGHTALYYAARQGHPDAVDVLVQAGAILGNFDTGFAELAVKNALRTGDKLTLKIWARTNVKIPGLYDDL
ncbi:L-asparaginase [Macrolepiota fuliginosa MF-IS2]|uniref:asparaginase n=1 Tax=Macrolepiota fuliginosa MF-IS2 TaxID=1400762 RepID=A0A9P6C2G3_9AGAR|nr:L-asparaginase [Macrolepiota fuliginosa MF-IS2]